MVLTFIKCALFAAALWIGWSRFHRELSRGALAALLVLAAACALAADTASRLLPPLTDEVVLTALGEGREEAEGTEVFLAGCTVDGREYSSGRSLKITDGHWFWSGESCCWRPEADVRRPDGVTRSVSLQIPVGRSRALNFEGAACRGKVEIRTAEGVRTADTYSRDGSAVAAELGGSADAVLARDQARRLALYAALFLPLYGGTAACVLSAVRDPARMRRRLKKHAGVLACGGISLAAFLLMVYYADRTSLWLDELYQVYFTKGSLGKALCHCLNLEERSTPLALLCATLWYRVAPYGERWLMLPSMLLSALAAFFTGLAGNRIQGRCCGVFAAAFTAFSATVWLNSAYEYRAYPYFVFFSALTLYCYILRNERQGIGRGALFSLSLTALAMTHYFGMIACAGYFAADLWLLWRRRISWKMGFVYVLPGVCSILWLLAVMGRAAQAAAATLWYELPGIAQVDGLLRFLCGYSAPVYGLALLGTVFPVGRGLRALGSGDGTEGFRAPFYRGFAVWTGAFPIALLVFYGHVVNSESTMWSERYFMYLMPFAYLLAALAGDWLLSAAAKKAGAGERMRGAVCLLACLVLAVNCVGRISSATSRSLADAGSDTTRSSEPYREAADWLYTRTDDIFNPDTLVFVRRGWMVADGWSEYYITRQGRRDALKTATQGKTTEESLRPYNRIYLQYDSAGTTPYMQALLDRDYVLTEDHADIGIRVYDRRQGGELPGEVAQ